MVRDRGDDGDFRLGFGGRDESGNLNEPNLELSHGFRVKSLMGKV